MIKPTLCILTLAAAALLQSGCERPSYGRATPKAGDEFALLQKEMTETLQAGEMTREEAEEIDELLRYFIATADAGYATKHSGLTMLHLACLYKHAELARCLLQDGASPHASLKGAGFCGVSEADASPLLLSVLSDAGDEQEILSLIQNLIKAGAVVNMQREGQLCSHESVYLALLQQADRLEDFPADESGIPLSIGKTAAENGWDKALAALLQRRNGKLTPGDQLLLHFVAANNTGQPGYLKCAQLLLEHGISADTQDAFGATPLFTLMTGLSFQHENGIHALPLAELLLRHGADVNKTAEHNPEFPGFTPLDFLLTRPEWVQELRNRGFQLLESPICWENVDDLPREICRAQLREKADGTNSVSAQTAAQFDTISRILTPDSTMQQNPLYAEALSAGVELMSRIDPIRTSQLLENMPLWTDALVWQDRQPHALAIMEAVMETPALILPKELVCRAAETMIQHQLHDTAATMLELLSRCPDAEADINRYAQDSRPAMQAGALQAKLLRAGMPPAKCYAVRDWLEAHGKTADTPVLRKAVLLTSQEDIWFGNMSKENLEAVFSSMEEIGAPRAAQAYRSIAAALDDADKLDAITADSHTWKFELESATALFFLQHADQFLPVSSSNEKNTD